MLKTQQKTIILTTTHFPGVTTQQPRERGRRSWPRWFWLRGYGRWGGLGRLVGWDGFAEPYSVKCLRVGLPAR